ncbi:NAD(P)-binding protein [Gonapodya prolifera JEL478]|uniref:NAD(P)-binding protein n=1 Tax=Gonapodya prolifera (strain JEL478) TaxID=1344416 RepID=A0A139A8A7_GONPJ|nr:NAD(P)-binding protein [Gonapodya prolifera JEL478]|eukprot:KXS12918.1 NAD(P)-binding protein [Gonapodya prolifera JEL478]
MPSSPSLHFLITGAPRGIGRGLTRALLQRGHRVFLVDSNKPELDHTLSLASGWATSSSATSPTSPPAFHGELADLGDRTHIRRAVASASAFFSGRLDVLAQWDAKIAVGLTAPFILSRLCVPVLVAAASGPAARPGCIVNVSSTRAYQAEPNHEAYSAGKAGLLGLTRAMAVSLGERHHVRVNAIVPVWIAVEAECAAADASGVQWGDGLSEADHAWHLAGRVGTVRMCAFVTGEEIVLDGGVTRKMVYPE